MSSSRLFPGISATARVAFEEISLNEPLCSSRQCGPHAQGLMLSQPSDGAVRPAWL